MKTALIIRLRSRVAGIDRLKTRFSGSSSEKPKRGRAGVAKNEVFGEAPLLERRKGSISAKNAGESESVTAKNEVSGERTEHSKNAKNEVFGEVLAPAGRTITVRPSKDEAIKPSELIQISGHQSLTLNARRSITLLWHNAHMQGIEEGKDYTIALSDLRPERRKGNDELETAITLLMQTILIVKLKSGHTRRVQFLGGNDLKDSDRDKGVLTYSFDKRLVEILRDSQIWGRIAIPVLMAFSSKYAVSLYENLSQWSNLTFKSIQELTLAELRDMMGVEDGKYAKFGDFNIHVLRPAILEINALAPFNVSVHPIKQARNVVGFKIGWWAKTTEELKEAFLETQRSRIGRRARLSGRSEELVSDENLVEQLLIPK
nr:replication initiation protein [Paracoccus litorisediminis]